MATMRQIRLLADRIAGLFKPRRIILFGSHAYGSPTADSDVDLLIVMPFRGDSARQEFAIRQAVRAPFPLDVLVRTPTELARRAAWNDYFVKEVLDKGKVLYEAPHARVDQESRGGLSKRAARDASAQTSKP